MELFRFDIRIDTWGVIYVGVKLNWISKNEVIKYAEKGCIVCSESRLLDLYLIENDELFDFLMLLRKFIKDDNHPLIEFEESDKKAILTDFPVCYSHFWGIEFLLRVKNENIDLDRKLVKISVLYADFGYPINWKPFVYYEKPPIKEVVGSQVVYDCFSFYLENEIARLQKSVLCM